MSNLDIQTVGALSSFGSFILAGLIALIGYSQSKKKDSDRVYQYLEKITKSKTELEIALASFVNHQDDIEVFSHLDTKYTAFVNYLEYFSAKILNQKLYRTRAFKDLQGDSSQVLREWAIIQLQIFSIINYTRFDTFEIVSVEKTRRAHLRNTYKLLKLTLPSKEYQELQDLCKEHGLF